MVTTTTLAMLRVAPDDPRRFALALDAGFGSGSQRSLDWLGGGPPGSGIEGLGYRMLVGENAEDPRVLVERLDWLDREGHRGRGSTLAYDRALQVDLARAGVAVGFLQPAPAWAYLERAAESVLGRIRSWEEFAEELIAGWEAKVQRPLGRDRAFILDDLLGSPRSYWRRIPWPR